MDVGIVTDEVSRTVAEAFDVAMGWGVRLFELREGAQRRFPDLAPEEIQTVETVVRQGARITAVSPGIMKGPVEDTRRLRDELERVLPRSIALAGQLGCDRIIVFGFERAGHEGRRHRVNVLRAFEQAAECAAGEGMKVLVENEPGFWIDTPEETAALLAELDHPHLRVNWDPANVVWGEHEIARASFDVLAPFIENLHVKDYHPRDPDQPWVPVGDGVVPWDDTLEWIVRDTALEHVTLETHCEPLMANARTSLERVREMLERVETI